ncbi:MAG: protein kinase [Planctomycetaceae bacterium]
MTTTFEQIQSLCRDFRRQLRSGARTRMEDYLDRVYEDSREMLFQNLLHIEIEFQRRQGNDPASDDYVRRFPQHARLIRQAFFESTQMSADPAAATPADQRTELEDVPPGRRLGDYELLRQIGRGAFGAVYQARHMLRGDIVALKLLPLAIDGNADVSGDADRLHKFRREFRALCDVNHPNLVGMQSLEVDGRQWFFTMDLVEGTDFLDYVRPTGAADIGRLMNAARQLADGLAALHRLKIIHRDLKPANVMVDGDGHVSILDFGLVLESRPRADFTVLMSQHGFAGTPLYAAPEQMFGDCDAASDWYAVGVMLYEALTGKPPFRGSGAEVMRAKSASEAPRLHGRADVPDDLARLVDELLQRDPEHRPAGEAVLDRLGIASESSSRDSTELISDSVGSGSRLSLIGREAELKTLKLLHRQLLQKFEPLAAFVRGRSGEGKTSLVEEFLRSIRTDGGALILAGRCDDRESVPFKAIDAVIDSLVLFLRSQQDDDVRRWLPDDIGLLAQLFPMLRRVTSISEQMVSRSETLDTRQLRHRAFTALRDLLTEIGSRTPIVLFIDDLQWGDGDSATALRDVLQPPEAPAVMLLGTYRSDEAADSPFLKEWTAYAPMSEVPLSQHEVEVGPLSEDQCLSLLAVRLGTQPDTVKQQARQLHESTQGNPYFLEQLLEGFDPQTGNIEAVPLAELIEQRLMRLPPAARSLLNAIAVAGQAVALTEAAQVAKHSTAAMSVVTHMRNERLVRLIGAGEDSTVDTYHDKIRETVLEAMLPQQQKRLHVQFGEMLEQAENLNAETVLQFLEQDPLLEESAAPDSDRIYDLAFHFHAAGDQRGFAYQFLAGELSFRAYASEDALEFLSRAEKYHSSEPRPRLNFRLHERLGRTHQRLRQFDDGLRHLNIALKQAECVLQRAHVYEYIGATHAGRGEYRPALTNYDLTLRELGLTRPVGVPALLRCLPEILRVLLRPPNWNSQPYSSAEERARFEIYLRALNSLLMFIWELPDGMASYLYFLLRMQNTARFINGTEFWGKTVAHSAGQIALNGMPWLGRRLLERTQPAADEIHDVETRGFFLAGSAMPNQYTNKLQLADQQYAEGYRLLFKSGTHYYLGAVAHVHRHLHAVIAPSSVELKTAQQTLSAARSLGDRRTQCWGHYDVANALARAGDISRALEHIERARHHLKVGERYLTDAIFLGTEGYVRLQASSYAAARFSLEASCHLALRRKLLMDVVVRSLPYLMESLLGPNWLHRPQPEIIRRLQRLGRVASAVDWIYPNIASPACRAKGRSYASMGRIRKAIRCFRKAVQRAEAIGADYDRARCLLDLAAVEEDQRDERRAEAIELLKQQESTIPWAERWLLGDQFDPGCICPDPQNLNYDAGTESG